MSVPFGSRLLRLLRSAGLAGTNGVALPTTRMEDLRQAGIGVQVHYIPVYRHPYYRQNGFEDFALPHAEAYYAEAISLPMYPGLSDGDVDRVVAEVTRLVSA